MNKIASLIISYRRKDTSQLFLPGFPPASLFNIYIQGYTNCGRNGTKQKEGKNDDSNFSNHVHRVTFNFQVIKGKIKCPETEKGYNSFLNSPNQKIIQFCLRLFCPPV